MLVIAGLVVVLVGVTVVLNMLSSARGTHDSFAVLGQQVGDHVFPVRDGARGDGVGMARRIAGRRTASTMPDVASTK